MTGRRFRPALIAGLAAALAGPAAPAAAEEERTVDAFAVCQASGQAYRTGEATAVFVGALRGPIFVETDEGPIQAGEIICPGIVDFSLADGSQTGEGRCIMTATDGAQMFADWTCEGFHLIGCAGDFTLTGGTERFTGVTGGGRVTWRSGLHRVVSGGDDDRAIESAVGIAFWRDFTYKLP